MGADLTGKEYSALIDSLNPGRTIIVSSTSSSGGMFETLAGKNRVLVAASRSGEKEDTVFYEHFLAGLKGVAADEDKDKKVSVWEASSTQRPESSGSTRNRRASDRTRGSVRRQEPLKSRPPLRIRTRRFWRV